MTNNKIKKTAQKMVAGFKTNATEQSYIDDINNITNIAKSASRNWKEMTVKLTEYLRDVEEYISSQFKGQDNIPQFTYTVSEDNIVNINIVYNNISVLRTIVCKHLF